jgi:hypothetical protein
MAKDRANRSHLTEIDNASDVRSAIASSEEEDVATVVDDELAEELKAALAQNRQLAEGPDATVILERSIVPEPPRTLPMLPHTRSSAPPAPATVLTFALPEREERSGSMRGEQSARAATTQRRRAAREHDRPVLVAHVITPRPSLALVAALLAWACVLVLAVYVVIAHKTVEPAPPAPSASTTPAMR